MSRTQYTSSNSNANYEEMNRINGSEIRRELEIRFGIDTNDRTCGCGSTEVTHVREINIPTNYEIQYNCESCAIERDGSILIPVEYAQVRLTRTNQNRSGYFKVIDKRNRMGYNTYE